MGRIIGIDLGTTNSLVAVWENGQSVLIPNAWGEVLTPSAVSFDADGTVYVGRIAKERKMTHPEITFTSFKRFMGTSYQYKAYGKTYKPEELSALVLRQLKEDAESYLGEPVEEAVISVPAYFNDVARKATKNAGMLAGLTVDRIINEPSAAALACQNQDRQEDMNAMVFDFGGGTLDVSIVECFENIVEITAISGDNRLGGDDFDHAIAAEFCRRHDFTMEVLTEQHRTEILAAATQCKLQLSETESAEMMVRYGGTGESMTLTRQELIIASQELFLRMENPVKRALADWKHGAEELNRIIMVGGSCKMPVVQYLIKHMMRDLTMSVTDPDLMVALGMGVYAGIKERSEDVRDMLLTDVCPFSLGTEIFNQGNPNMGIMHVLIERNTALPASREDTFYPVNENQGQIEFGIFQGEEFYAEDNLKLGSMSISLPMAKNTQRSITVRYTYDINGLLLVDARVNYTGKTFQKVIVNSQVEMSRQEIRKQVKKLEHLKIHPRDKEENKFLWTRADRLFQTSTGSLRDDIAERMKYFDYLLGKQDELVLARWRKVFTPYLDEVEAIMRLTKAAMHDAADFAAWYDNYVDNRNSEEEKEMLQIYEHWKDKRILN